MKSLLYEIQKNTRLYLLLLASSIFSTNIYAAPQTFDWRTASQNDTTGTFSLTVGGITATARAYTAEQPAIGAPYSIFGPFPTTKGHNDKPVFHNGQPEEPTDPESEGLGLRVQPINGIGVDGYDSGLRADFGVSIDNFRYIMNNEFEVYDGTARKTDFILFEFDKEVTLSSITLSPVSNGDKDIWIATSDQAPDLSKTLDLVFNNFAVSNKTSTSGVVIYERLETKHTNVRYLAIGAPPLEAAGIIDPNVGIEDDRFFITEFQVDTAEPPPEPVGDLSISDVKITQGVYDPDYNNDKYIDIIQGRKTAILATIMFDGFSNKKATIEACISETTIENCTQDNIIDSTVQEVSLDSNQPEIEATLLFTANFKNKLKYYIHVEID